MPFSACILLLQALAVFQIYKTPTKYLYISIFINTLGFYKTKIRVFIPIFILEILVTFGWFIDFNLRRL